MRKSDAVIKTLLRLFLVGMITAILTVGQGYPSGLVYGSAGALIVGGTFMEWLDRLFQLASDTIPGDRPDYLRIYELEVENGVRSALTVNEILAFQCTYGLYPDGHLGQVTAFHLAQNPEWIPPDEPCLSDAPLPVRDGMLSCKCDRPTKTLDIKTYNAFRPINRVCAECGRQARYTRQHPPSGGDTWKG